MTEYTPSPPPRFEADTGEPLHRPHSITQETGQTAGPVPAATEGSTLAQPPSTHQHLSPEAINAWRIAGAVGSLFYWIIPLGYGIIAIGTQLPGWPVWLLAVFFFLYTLSEATWLPWIRWKRWRYRVDQHEIDLQYGFFVVTRTLIPVKRVQHVDTRQGPVYRSFELATVTITTAGDTHEIPALSETVADDLRRTISEYARVAQEDL